MDIFAIGSLLMQVAGPLVNGAASPLPDALGSLIASLMSSEWMSWGVGILATAFVLAKTLEALLQSVRAFLLIFAKIAEYIPGKVDDAWVAWGLKQVALAIAFAAKVTNIVSTAVGFDPTVKKKVLALAGALPPLPKRQ